MTEMISYAADLTEYKVGETMGFPEDNTTDTLNEVGSVVIPTSLSQSVQALHQFLFGNDGYAVSSTVQEIESGISVRAADRATSDSYVEEEETYDYSGGTSNSTGTTDWSNSTGGGTDWTGGTGTGGGTDWTGGTGTGGALVRIQAAEPEQAEMEQAAEVVQIQAAEPEQATEAVQETALHRWDKSNKCNYYK